MGKLDIKHELDENQTILLLMPSIEYNDEVLDVAKDLSGKSVCYVTLNKTFSSLNELFKKNKVDIKNFIFVDAISKTLKKTPDQAEGAYFVSSPSALTELSLTITKFMKHGFDYLVFDSVTNLLIYENKGAVTKFISSIVNKIKGTKTKAIFYAIDIADYRDLIDQVSTFVDKAKEIEK